MTNIRTKWHKILPLVESNDVVFTGPPGGHAPHWDEFKHDKEAFMSFLKIWNDLPHFCIDRELIDLAKDEEYRKSLWDMKQAGVLRLPFPVVVVEFPATFDPTNERHTTRHNIVLLRDLHVKERFFWEAEEVIDDSHTSNCDFYGIAMGINEDTEGNYLNLSPSIVYVGIHLQDGVVMCNVIAHGSGVAHWDERIEELVGQTYEKDLGTVFFAANAIYLLMGTRGVDKEVIDTERVNKKRGASGKPLIPTHTYVHIGRVYRSAVSDQSDEYIPRRSPRPHWRRGHNRSVHFGAGRQFMRTVYINPRLVAYAGNEAKPKPDYIVTK